MPASLLVVGHGFDFGRRRRLMVTHTETEKLNKTEGEAEEASRPLL